MSRAQYREALIERIKTPVSQETLLVGSVSTAFLSAGSGPPLILLHGAGAGAVTWYPTIDALSPHFRIIAPDIVGYGESDKPDAAYDRPFFSAWLTDFLAALSIDKAHIVGLSQGGAIALQFALDKPESVAKLVLIDAGALSAKVPLSALLGMLWLNLLPSSAANHAYSRVIMFDTKKRDPMHSAYSLAVIKGANGKKAFSQGRGAAVAQIPYDALRQVNNETLIVWGEQDKLFPVEDGRAASLVIPNATFVGIQNAGHMPHMDQPELFNRTLLHFLKE